MSSCFSLSSSYTVPSCTGAINGRVLDIKNNGGCEQCQCNVSIIQNQVVHVPVVPLICLLRLIIVDDQSMPVVLYYCNVSNINQDFLGEYYFFLFV